MAWVILAGFALAYLSGLYLFYVGGSMSAGYAERHTLAQAAHGAAGIESLRGEIAALRQRVEQLQRREDDLRERLATMEAAFGPNTASLPPQSHEASMIRRSPVSVTYSPLPQDGFGDLMIDRSPLPVSGGGQAMKTMFGVELARGESTGALRKKWAQLGAEHKALLAGLQARSAEGPADSDALRLIAGPFPNAAEAAQLCASLRAAKSECTETVFSGERF